MMNNRYSLYALALSLAMAGSARGDDLVAHYKQTIEKLLPGMSAEKIPDRQEPQQSLEKLCHQAGTPGKDADREAISKAIMSFVGPETAKPARIWLLRKIEPLGREEVVEGLTALLADADKDVRETARRALANNPSEDALKALRAELAKGGDVDWQVAMVNALSWRHDAASIPALNKLAAGADVVLAKAAISALGDMGDEASLQKLKELQQKAPESLQVSLQDALLRGSQRFAAHGLAAVSVLKARSALDQPEHHRISAVTILANATGAAGAGGLLLQFAKGEDKHMALIATRLLERMDNSVTPMIIDALKGSSPDATALLLEALGNHGDPAAMKAVSGYAEDSNAEVRLAAVEALGKIGNGDAVAVLIKRGASGEGEEREAARNSLAVLRGKDIDDIILRDLEKSEGTIRLELIQAVWGRRVMAAKPVLFRLAEGKNEAVQAAVLNAMERLGDQNDLPKLVAMLAQTGKAGREVGEKAILSICRRAGDAEAATGPIVAAMAKADAGEQVALIHALGRLQTMDALVAVRKASQSGDATVKKAALEAMKEWRPIRITEWQYAGPFAEKDKDHLQLFDIAFPPEAGPQAGNFKPLKGKAGDDGSIDLSKIPGATANCCCYVRAIINSDKQRDIVLSLGSDDGMKAWLNGKVVHTANLERSLKCDQDQVKVSLNDGPNVLLIKVTQGAGEWSLCVGVRDVDGAPPEGLRFEAK